MPPFVRHTGRTYSPGIKPNAWTLPRSMNNGVKEFHRVAEPAHDRRTGRSPVRLRGRGPMKPMGQPKTGVEITFRKPAGGHGSH